MSSNIKPKIAFVCVHNSCRSQMAEALRNPGRKINTELVLKESIPIIDNLFMYKLKLEHGEGLYKVTVNSIMPAPRGIVYPEITNFYVEYRK